jgi:hypothetical protein
LILLEAPGAGNVMSCETMLSFEGISPMTVE